ncbi:MAG: hypothetical protein WCH34_05885 [Bacteroidota bacterium]
MAYKLDYVDTFYDFKGLWGTPSRCGLKIVRKDDVCYIIATELFTDNPGSSITDCNAKLAQSVCDEFNLPHEKVYFIEHVPDKGSKLVFYEESLYHIKLHWNGTKFENPQWEKLSKEQLHDLIS